MPDRDPDFFKLHYRQWRQRMHKLRVPYDVQGALLAVVIETHLTGSPPADDDYVLAGLLMVSPRKARAVIDKLSKLGLVQISDGFVIDKTAVQDAAERAEMRGKKRASGREGGVRSGVVRRGHAMVQSGTSQTADDKSMKNNKTGEALLPECFELEKRREEKSSDTNVSGGSPPKDPTKVVFDSGVLLLSEAGISEQRAKPIIGKWRRDHGDEAVIAAIGKARREGAVDPVSFCEGVFRHRRKQSPDARDVEGKRYVQIAGGFFPEEG